MIRRQLIFHLLGFSLTSTGNFGSYPGKLVGFYRNLPQLACTCLLSKIGMKTVVLYVEDEPDDILFMSMAFKRAGLADLLQSVGDGGERQ